jgi:hypothetical protein
MKRIALFVVAFAACGEQISTLSNETSSSFVSGQSQSKLKVSSLTLSDESKVNLEGSYVNLEVSSLRAEKAVTLDADLEVAVLDVSASLDSARLRTVREIWVPAGTAQQPKDPNRSKVFYIAVHDQQVPTIYGPFEVRGQEGSKCGATIAGALPSCRTDLTCVQNDSPDMPGSCE